MELCFETFVGEVAYVPSKMFANALGLQGSFSIDTLNTNLSGQ